MGVAGLAGLPLVVATLDHRHLVVVGRDPEDSLRAQAVQSWGRKQSVSIIMIIFNRFYYRESGLSAWSGSMEDVGLGTCPSEYPESPPEFLRTLKDERSGVLTGQYPQGKVSWLSVSQTVLSAPASCCRYPRSVRSKNNILNRDSISNLK